MCDTIAATGRATQGGVTLFGKNSDREPNEAQILSHIPGVSHAPGTSLKCTYISIPQVEHTHTVMLSRPFWMWGAEMGVNEHGLAIGNEAVFTKVPYEKGPGLTGMDLLRLGLERAGTAEEAVTVITGLIEEYGQGGNCSRTGKVYYHNSFLMADPESVWVLETVDRHWAAKKIDGVYAISNRLTIENDWDLASDDLVSFAIKKKWCRSAEDFSFAGCYSDWLYTTFSASTHRRQRAMGLLEKGNGTLDIKDFFSILRDHGETPQGDFRPDKGIFGAQICNHAGWGPVRISQTTGSLVSRLSPESGIHFVTGTSAPCLSLFKPVWTDTPLDPSWLSAGASYDPDSMFWAHEQLHRKALKNYSRSAALISEKREEIESGMIDQAMSLAGSGLEDRQAFVNQTFDKALEFDRECIKALESLPEDTVPGFLYAGAWRKWSRASGVPY